MREFETKFVPNPIQQGFIESRHEADLFSSRMGEGKSAGLVWKNFYHTVHNPGADWAIIRNTWENLRATTLEEFFKWFPPGVAGTWSETKKTFTWAEGLASGTTEFMGLDDPEDLGKLQSRAFAGFGIDEASPAQGETGGVPEAVFDIAMGRLRQMKDNGEPFKWYGVGVVENNPDESHWTYRRFVYPGTEPSPPEEMQPWQAPGYAVWHPLDPENVRNLPTGYYERLRRTWAHRDDLVNRFVEGRYGFQQIGKAVTPQWQDEKNLAVGLVPVRNAPLQLLWDFGLNPTCTITQVTPLGYWLILDCMVGDGIGVEELIEDAVKPTLVTRYPRASWRHIGDPAGKEREQTSSARSAVRAIVQTLGGSWRDGPVKLENGLEPLRAVLRQTVTGGRGRVLVDRDHATAIWHALRGGWHYHVGRTGITSSEPVKNMHSHPGDTMRYGAGVLFPLTRLLKAGKMEGGQDGPAGARFFGRGPKAEKPGLLGFEQPYGLPKQAPTKREGGW